MTDGWETSHFFLSNITDKEVYQMRKTAFIAIFALLVSPLFAAFSPKTSDSLFYHDHAYEIDQEYLLDALEEAESDSERAQIRRIRKRDLQDMVKARGTQRNRLHLKRLLMAITGRHQQSEGSDRSMAH